MTFSVMINQRPKDSVADGRTGNSIQRTMLLVITMPNGPRLICMVDFVKAMQFDNSSDVKRTPVLPRQDRRHTHCSGIVWDRFVGSSRTGAPSSGCIGTGEELGESGHGFARIVE